jgi:hypothetical protein
MHHILLSHGFVLLFFKISRMLSRFIVSNPSFFLISSVSNVSDHLFLPSGDLVHACAMISTLCLLVYFWGCPGLGFSVRAL